MLDLSVPRCAIGVIADEALTGVTASPWQKACAADARSVCEDLYFLQDGYCEDGSGWACNELGILLTEHYGNRRRVAMEFERACGLGFSAGCGNTVAITQGDIFRRDAPTVADYRFILRGSKGPFPDREPAQLYARACEQLGRYVTDTCRPRARSNWYSTSSEDSPISVNRPRKPSSVSSVSSRSFSSHEVAKKKLAGISARAGALLWEPLAFRFV